MTPLAAGVGAKAALGEIIPATIVVTSGCALVLFSIFCFVAAVWRQLIPGVRLLNRMFIGYQRRFSSASIGILVAISAAAFAGLRLS
jgi:putative membrane protein